MKTGERREYKHYLRFASLGPTNRMHVPVIVGSKLSAEEHREQDGAGEQWNCRAIGGSFGFC